MSLQSSVFPAVGETETELICALCSQWPEPSWKRPVIEFGYQKEVLLWMWTEQCLVMSR